jgi:hypothetical protein
MFFAGNSESATVIAVKVLVFQTFLYFSIQIEQINKHELFLAVVGSC